MLQRYKIEIEYIGSSYYGMQRQSGLRTVQGNIEAALQKAFGGMDIKADFCGRTDAGVHALAQVMHFDAPHRDERKMIFSINNNLRKDDEILCISSTIVSNDFHSRFSCKQREYIYKIATKSSLFAKDRAMTVRHNLNIDSMQSAANVLIGNHNFSAFRGGQCSAISPVKTINCVKIWQEYDTIFIHICAKSFVYHMVRLIVPCLVKAGHGEITPEDVKNILESGQRQSLVAPAYGLYFLKAVY